MLGVGEKVTAFLIGNKKFSARNLRALEPQSNHFYFLSPIVLFVE